MIQILHYNRQNASLLIIITLCAILSFAAVINAYSHSATKVCFRSKHYASNYNDCSQILTTDVDSSYSLQLYKKISRALLFSTLGIALQNSITQDLSAHAIDSYYEQSSLYLSDSLITTTKVPLLKDTIKVQPSTKSATTSTIATPKLAEEAALEGAINKRSSGKARLDTLNLEIKSYQAKLTTLKNEIKALENAIKKTDSKIKKVNELKDISTSAEFDDSQKKILKEMNNDNSLAQKKISEVRRLKKLIVFSSYIFTL